MCPLISSCELNLNDTDDWNSVSQTLHITGTLNIIRFSLKIGNNLGKARFYYTGLFQAAVFGMSTQFILARLCIQMMNNIIIVVQDLHQ
jgi:hypothetical protein